VQRGHLSGWAFSGGGIVRGGGRLYGHLKTSQTSLNGLVFYPSYHYLNFNKKLSSRKETVQLLRGSVLAKYNWKTIYCGHHTFISQPLWRNRPPKLSNSVK